jgi:hypothetical protein
MTRSLFPLLLVTLLGTGQAWAASDRDAKFQDVGQISDQGVTYQGDLEAFRTVSEVARSRGSR